MFLVVRSPALCVLMLLTLLSYAHARKAKNINNEICVVPSAYKLLLYILDYIITSASFFFFIILVVVVVIHDGSNNNKS